MHKVNTAKIVEIIYRRGRKGPQIRFALSRGFANSGLISWASYPGRRARSLALARGYFRPPFQGFHFAALPRDFARSLSRPMFGVLRDNPKAGH